MIQCRTTTVVLHWWFHIVRLVRTGKEEEIALKRHADDVPLKVEF